MQPRPHFYAGKSASNVSWDVSGNYKLNPDVNLYARIATRLSCADSRRAGRGHRHPDDPYGDHDLL